MTKHNRRIRKIMIGMMVGMTLLAMSGCGKKTADHTSTGTETETTTEVTTEATTEVAISRESTPCQCCDGTIHFFLAIVSASDYTAIPEEYKIETTTYPMSNMDYQDNVTYGKLTEDIDFYTYSQDGDFVYLDGYITKDSNVKIFKNSDNKDWVILSTECGFRTVKYEDIITSNLYVEVDEFKFSYEETTEVAGNNTDNSGTTADNHSNVQPEQSGSQESIAQPPTETEPTAPPSNPTTEEVVEPTVTADMIVAEFNAAFSANGMTPAPDGPSGLGYAGIRCHAGNYVDQAWDTASFMASVGTKYFYITISDNGDGSFMVTYYTG